MAAAPRQTVTVAPNSRNILTFFQLACHVYSSAAWFISDWTIHYVQQLAKYTNKKVIFLHTYSNKHVHI